VKLRCEGKTAYGNTCGHDLKFAVWYQGDHDSAQGVCGQHLAQIVTRMLTDSTQSTGRFVQVTETS
jgi:hypothetical protein